MERAFVVDVVKDAVGQIEKNGEAAFRLFHDPTGPFIAKDAYIFVIDPSGVDLVNPGFPNLEGRNILDVKDTQGKIVDPGDAPGRRNQRFRLGRLYVAQTGRKCLHAEVRLCEQGEDGRQVGAGGQRCLPGRCSQSGAGRREDDRSGTDDACPGRSGSLGKERREGLSRVSQKGSKWFRDDTYFFVWTMDGTRVFHAADPAVEGRNASGVKDVLGRPSARCSSMRLPALQVRGGSTTCIPSRGTSSRRGSPRL